MNSSNAKDYLPFVQAMAEGKVVLRRNTLGQWLEDSNLDFNLPPDWYRIKPEPRKPRERWINVYSGYELNHPTEELADRNIHTGRLECVHYKEVIDEE